MHAARADPARLAIGVSSTKIGSSSLTMAAARLMSHQP
jgi:hypothetical protein